MQTHPNMIKAHGGDTLVILCALAFFGSASFVLGPLVCLVCGGCFALYWLFKFDHTLNLMLLIGGVCLMLINPRPGNDLFWETRFDYAYALILQDKPLWSWVFEIHFVPETIAAGCISFASLVLSYDLWLRSPMQQIMHKHSQNDLLKPPRFLTQWALSHVNRSPAALTFDTTLIGLDPKTRTKLVLKDHSLNTHLLITGTTGSGKTVTLLNFVESFVDRALPVIFIDGKGDLELARTLKSYCQRHARQNWMFSMAGPSCKYNPLVGNYTALKDMIIGLRKEWSEEHYLKLAEGYLQMVFKVLEQTQTPITLIKTAHMLKIDRLMACVRHAHQSGQLSQSRAQNLMSEIQDQEDAAKHIESLKAELLNIANSNLRPLFDITPQDPPQNILTLVKVIEHKAVAYLGLSPMLYPEVSGVVGRLILNDLKSSLDPLNPQKLLLVIDEISTLISTNMLNVLNQGRFLGLHIILTAQSLADLGQKIPHNANLYIRQMIANCNVYILHKVNDAEDAEQLAAILGTSLEFEHTAQVSAFGFETGLGSLRLVHQYKVHPDTLKSLKTGQAILCDKNTSKDPQYFLARKGDLVK